MCHRVSEFTFNGTKESQGLLKTVMVLGYTCVDVKIGALKVQQGPTTCTPTSIPQVTPLYLVLDQCRVCVWTFIRRC